MRVDQWLPAVHRGDAVGDEAFRIRTVLRKKGIESDVFALTVDEDVESEVYPFGKSDSFSPDVTILHFALASSLTKAFVETKGKKILIYHNITPSSFFVGSNFSFPSIIFAILIDSIQFFNPVLSSENQ